MADVLCIVCFVLFTISIVSGFFAFMCIDTELDTLLYVLTVISCISLGLFILVGLVGGFVTSIIQ